MFIKFNYDAKWCSGHSHTFYIFKEKNNAADSFATELDDSRNSWPSSIILLLEVYFNAIIIPVKYYLLYYNFEKLEMKM